MGYAKRKSTKTAIETTAHIKQHLTQAHEKTLFLLHLCVSYIDKKAPVNTKSNQREKEASARFQYM